MCTHIRLFYFRRPGVLREKGGLLRENRPSLREFEAQLRELNSKSWCLVIICSGIL